MLGEPAAISRSQQVLRDVGVLVLVDQRVAEAALILRQHIGVLLEQAQHLEQEVAEVGGVELLQPLLVGGIERGALALGEGEGFPARHLVGREAAVLPAVDQGRELARGPAVLVEPLALDHLLDEADLVVGVEDGEARLEADELGMAAQDLDADGMEGAEPRHALDRAADQRADALLHLARGLVGEGHGQDLGAAGASRAQDVGNAGGEHARLAGARAGQHQHGAVHRLHGRPLLGVEVGHVGRRGHSQRSRRDRSSRCNLRCGRKAGRSLLIRAHCSRL